MTRKKALRKRLRLIFRIEGKLPQKADDKLIEGGGADLTQTA